MLAARRAGFWRNGYEISLDGKPLTTWDKSFWRTGGQFDLAGHRYEVRSNAWGTRYELRTRGELVAMAERLGRKNWTVSANGVAYEFQRASVFRSEQVLLSGGRPVGSVRRTSWTGNAVAELPGMPVPVQVFVLAVVLTKWDNDSANAGTAASMVV